MNISKQLGIIGMGKMGYNLYKNLRDSGFEPIGYDYDPHLQEKLNLKRTLNEVVDSLQTPRLVWVMVPESVTGDIVQELMELLEEGDTIIDGGNSHFRNSVECYNKAKALGINFLDVGTSGGVEGARNGACLMIGGDRAIFELYEHLFEHITENKSYLYCGPSGSGHYLKMVHNGIEYGMMQSIAEGFNILEKSEYDYNLENVAKIFNNGSVIRSWLMELMISIYSDSNDFSSLLPQVNSSGEGKWTVEEALRLQVSAPVITQSLLFRYHSKENGYTEKLVGLLRNQFGGHSVIEKD